MKVKNIKTKICFSCKKEFFKPETDSYKYFRERKFCSRQCMDLYFRNRSLTERIKNKTINNGECLEWNGGCRGLKLHGYPVLGMNGKTKSITRLLWEEKYEKIPKDYCVCHKCDNTKCIKLSHLFLGTRKDNIQDAVKKGRMHFGERNGSAKLTQQKVQEIRKMHQKESCINIAKKYNVSPMLISLIRNNKIWKKI